MLRLSRPALASLVVSSVVVPRPCQLNPASGSDQPGREPNCWSTDLRASPEKRAECVNVGLVLAAGYNFGIRTRSVSKRPKAAMREGPRFAGPRAGGASAGRRGAG